VNSKEEISLDFCLDTFKNSASVRNSDSGVYMGVMQKAAENIKLPFVILKQNLRKSELPTDRKFSCIYQKGPNKTRAEVEI
jgi:hypothetical protein